ncbi:hypothetical protein QO010_001679 [Caulobacter ginsengisoli]|uniref:Uncharacterized protein n=1 Tax=Caulobacter ginsengisoli TaxID=400775 RepID=A0ABU0IPH1_9CAUL|nr:hypothetical protein [Caulobacter ginsengisoli]MDQ0463908.1 hypothetical protein [Caulobacter ginsengisoli]
MINPLLLQFGGSAVAVALMVGIAAWARISRPVAPLDPTTARTLLAIDYPDLVPDVVWISADTRGAIARAGKDALVLYRLGDSWVTRHMPWDKALKAPIRSGHIRLKLADPSAPMARLAVSGINPWPPEGLKEPQG